LIDNLIYPKADSGNDLIHLRVGSYHDLI